MRRYYYLTCQYAPCSKPFRSLRRESRYHSRTCANLASSGNRKNIIEDIKPVTVWSCGGGVESTAMAVLIATGKLPRPDYAVMVDSGYEKGWTWRYVNEVIIPKLRQIDIDLTTIHTNDWHNNALFDNSGHLLIPAFRKKEAGRVSKLHTHCNGWKAITVRRWIRSMGVERMESWQGIASNENHRMRPSSRLWISNRYPLIEINMTREHCLWLIGKEGWPKPEKSSCYFCPQQSDRQWQQLKDEAPSDWEKAIETDRAIRRVDPTVYLHRFCMPLDEAIG